MTKMQSTTPRTDTAALDVISVETHARALRAAYIRQMATAMVARLRRRSVDAAHA